MPTHKIGNLLEESVRRAGIQQKVIAAQIIDKFKDLIRKKWGKQISERIAALYVKNGILTIQTKDSVYSAELKLKEKEIIGELNKELKKTAIKKMRFLVR